MRLGDALDERLHCGAVGDVARLDLTRSTCGLDGSVDGAKAFSAAGNEDDMASVLGKTLCDGTADAAAGSSDDGDALFDDDDLPRRGAA